MSDTQTEPVEGYVCSVSGHKGLKRHHFVRRCPCIPGVHYRKYVTHGDEILGSEAYDIVCRRCWPQSRDDGPVRDMHDQSVETDEESSSSDELASGSGSRA